MSKLIDTSTWTKKEMEQGFAIRRDKNGRVFKLFLDNEPPKDKVKRMNDVNANNIDAFRKLRKEYAQNNIEYKQLNVGVFKKIKALDKGETVGTLTYYEENDKPIVHYIEVQKDYRRVGIATNMYKRLQDNYPNKEIKFGYLTPEGKKLLDKIGSTRKKQENNENVYYGHIIK